MGNSTGSYTTLHHERKNGIKSIILSFPDEQIAQEIVSDLYPGMRIIAIIPRYGSASEESGLAEGDVHFEVYLGEAIPTKMTPEVREATRQFYRDDCGFDQFSLREELLQEAVTTVTEALLVAEIRPIQLCTQTEDDWIATMKPFVADETQRKQMFVAFHQACNKLD